MALDTESTEAAFSFSRTESGGVLELRGGFHLDLARELHQTALQIADAGGAVVVDCRQVEHLDGCMVQVLLALKRALEQGGGSLGLRGASEEIRKYLGWAGLAGHFAAPGSEDSKTTAGPPKRRRNSRKPAA